MYATTASTNCVVSRLAVLKVARSARFALCVASSLARTTAVSIVGPDPLGLVERLDVARNGSSLWPKMANQIVYFTRFVILDL